jgi:RHS repeat-associated protein
VSLLLQDTNAPKATYGFQPYGAEARDPLRATDTADHFGDPTQSYRDAIRGDINLHDPTNPIRNTAKRLDSGHGGLDMGARQYSPDYKRFLQRDYLRPAQVQFGLVNSDWSANSYALASGNPVNFVEAGGHAVIVDEAGYGTASVGLLDPADWSCIPTPILGICIPWPKPIQSIGPTPAPTPTPTPAPQPTKTPDPKPTQVQQQAPGITACPPSSQATKWDLLPAPPGTGSWYGSGVHAFVRGPEQHSAAGECHVNVEIISTNWTENYHLYRRSGVYEDVILAGPASGQWKQFDFSGQLISANPPLNAPGIPLGPDEEATALIVAAAATATYQIATNNRLPATLTETYFYVTIDEPLHALAFFVP